MDAARGAVVRRGMDPARGVVVVGGIDAARHAVVRRGTDAATRRHLSRAGSAGTGPVGPIRRSPARGWFAEPGITHPSDVFPGRLGSVRSPCSLTTQ